MIDFVIDASALIELRVAAKPDPDLRRRALGGQGAAPELIDIEVLHVLRAMLRRGALTVVAAERAAAHFVETPISRIAHRPVLARVWELRDVLSAYDAAYVALAERLEVPLLTCDARLGRAHGHRAEVIVYASS